MILDTCRELLIQRNYTSITEDEDFFFAIDDQNDKFCIVKQSYTKLNCDSFAIILSTLLQMEIYHAILIYKVDATHSVKDSIKLLASERLIDQDKSVVIELFSEAELVNNITKHILQPQFRKLSLDEQIDYKKKFYPFGFIKTQDPIARFYGYKSGDIIEITRSDGIIYKYVKN